MRALAGMNRRRFLETSGGMLFSSALVRAESTREAGLGRSAASAPPAISGDPVDLDWEQRLTLTVGPGRADLIGSDDKVIQAGLDYVTRLGGGTVRVLPGVYRLRNAVMLPSNVRLVGSGTESVLIKEPSVTTRLVVDADWYDQEITLADASGFRVGDGVCLRARDPFHEGLIVLKRTLVARSGNRFKLDSAPRVDLWQKGEPTVSTLFPLLSGDRIANVLIESLTLDGNRDNNENLDGNYAGCIFLQDCNRATIRGVTARRYNGDGVSWQICHDIVVEDCHSHDHKGLGLHPGSGSQRPVIRNNRIERCNIGVFFCWGVRYGLAEKNRIEDCGGSGVSIGHRDTDNRIRDNDVLRSGKVGVLFRAEASREYGPHRNRVEGNRIVDSGAEDGVGVDVQGATDAATIVGNVVRETRGPGQRVGIRVGAEAREVALADNRIEGYSQDVADLRLSSP